MLQQPDFTDRLAARRAAEKGVAMGSMQYIREAYGVPAKRGARVKVLLDGFDIGGTITGTRGPYLRIRLDGRK